MGMINTSDMKNGMKVIFNNEPWVLLNVDFVKPGKGAAFYKIKVSNLLTGNVLDKTLRSGEKVEQADVLEAPMEYLYFDGDNYIFMDKKSYEQFMIPTKIMGDNKDFLTENLEVSIVIWNGDAINLTMPHSIQAKVTYTEPAVKGDTQSRVMKEATIETGGIVTVPTFIDIDEVIIVDTRTRQYSGRVSQ